MLKTILLAMVSTVAPFLYSALIDAAPDFPLAQAPFVETVIWFVGLLLGGWNFAKARVKAIARVNGIQSQKFRAYVEGL